MKDTTLTESEWDELLRDWDRWNDESCALHAAHILREAIKRAYPVVSVPS